MILSRRTTPLQFRDVCYCELPRYLTLECFSQTIIICANLSAKLQNRVANGRAAYTSNASKQKPGQFMCHIN